MTHGKRSKNLRSQTFCMAVEVSLVPVPTFLYGSRSLAGTGPNIFACKKVKFQKTKKYKKKCFLHMCFLAGTGTCGTSSYTL